MSSLSPATQGIASPINYVAQSPTSPITKEWDRKVQEAIGSYFQLEGVLWLAFALDKAIKVDESPFTSGQLKALKAAITATTSDQLSELMPYFQSGQFYGGLKKLLPKTRDAIDVRPITAHWRDDFLGQSVQAFFQAIQRRKNSPLLYYSKSLHIIQSSGAGKSRLIQQCGETVMTTSFVVRVAPVAGRATGFPPADPEIYELFVNLKGKNRDRHAVGFAFLKGIFAASKLIKSNTSKESVQLPRSCEAAGWSFADIM
jgi:hypothetical protein